MQRSLFFLIIAVFFVFPVFGQNAKLETYQSNFEAAKLETKLEILRSADGEDPVEFGPLYGQALRLVVNNAANLERDPVLRSIALKAIERVDAGGYDAAVGDLWLLFQNYPDSTTRIEVAEVMGRLAGNHPEEIRYLVNWVARQNSLNRSDEDVDLQVLASVLQALGELGSPVAFEPVLDTILVQYPDFVTDAARRTLGRLKGSPLELATGVITSKTVLEKGPAFTFLVDDDYIPDEQKPNLARTALSIALNTRPQNPNEQESVRQLRYAAAAVLRESGFSEATTEVIRHFNETVLEFDRKQTTKDRLLEAIATLGAMGNEAAATRLTDYLELLNTYTEQDRPYDPQVVLAAIQNLKILDYPGSYNALFMTTILKDYPDRVRNAAREASMSVMQ
ncbi:MAG: hypothetical protein WCY01_04700 [Alkalispirochaeta sp.]